MQPKNMTSYLLLPAFFLPTAAVVAASGQEEERRLGEIEFYGYRGLEGVPLEHLFNDGACVG